MHKKVEELLFFLLLDDDFCRIDEAMMMQVDVHLLFCSTYHTTMTFYTDTRATRVRVDNNDIYININILVVV